MQCKTDLDLVLVSELEVNSGMSGVSLKVGSPSKLSDSFDSCDDSLINNFSSLQCNFPSRESHESVVVILFPEKIRFQFLRRLTVE